VRFRPTLRRLWRVGSGGATGSLPRIAPQRGYELWAESYGRALNPVQQLEARALAEILPDLRDRLVLDLGAGKGRVSRLALERGARATVGMDFSLPMVRAAAAVRTGAAHWLAGDARRLPFRRHAFDVVVCALMLGHVQDLDAALAGIAEVVRPGGTLLVSDFHPCATLRGWQRAFVDEASGREYAIEQYAHLFDRYVGCLRALRFELEALREPLYDGFPIVFALRARKSLP
jgi:malonyl-CoA O-methyltransferase